MNFKIGDIITPRDDIQIPSGMSRTGIKGTILEVTYIHPDGVHIDVRIISSIFSSHNGSGWFKRKNIYFRLFKTPLGNSHKRLNY